MSLATLDANGWTVVIGAVGVVVLQVIGLILSYLREQNKVLRDNEALAATKFVAVQTQAVTEAVADTAMKIQTIQVQTDGMNKALVEAAKIQGAVAERDRVSTAKSDAILAQNELQKSQIPGIVPQVPGAVQPTIPVAVVSVPPTQP